jgi:nucleoside-diphosphate-sugar epimerase
MKILVTGANGYIGSTICKQLPYNTVKLTRDVVDLTNQKKVDEWFKDKRFDVVIHCATTGGLRTQVDGADVTHKNLQMFYNLLRNKNRFNKLINIASGAEFDRSQNIAPVWTEDGKRFPTDPYGMSKSIISKLVEQEENFYNIRVFATFDENELDTRFIKSNIQRYINNEPMLIHKDRLMDLFYMKDFIEVIKYYLTNKNLPKTIDCTYENTLMLSEIADVINSLDTHKVEVKVDKDNDFAYFGSKMPLEILKINLIGLKQGIKETYEKLNVLY